MASCVTPWLCSVASIVATIGFCSSPSCLRRRHERARIGRLLAIQVELVGFQRAALARHEPVAVTPYVSGRLPLMGSRLVHRWLDLANLHAELRTVRRVREVIRPLLLAGQQARQLNLTTSSTHA